VLIVVENIAPTEYVFFVVVVFYFDDVALNGLIYENGILDKEKEFLMFFVILLCSNNWF
jgi:hypothetical protein